MTNEKPNFIIEFENSNSTKEENEKVLLEFIKCLMRLSIKQEAQKAKTKKEQKKIEKDFIDYGLKVFEKTKNHSTVG